MRSKIFLFAAVLFLGISGSSFAQVKPAAIFGNGMVLQRDVPLNVRGTADPREKITVHIGDVTASAKTDRNGKWSVSLPAMEAGGPFTMTISGKSSGIVFDDVLVGDVWLCSGQSNMEWQVKNSVDAEKEIAAANHPEIRCFTVERTISMTPQDDVKGAWKVCSPETAGDFTAVGYFFARELQKDLDVPVGIINSSWGGTGIEAWTSPEGYAAFPADIRLTYDTNTPSNPNQHSSTLYNAMINPLTGYGIKGAIWYQGEHNASDAYAYRKLFPGMITDWRGKWGYDFPFYWVQLANFQAEAMTPADSQWAELREAQTMTLSLPRTGQAVIIDIGEAGDIHPRNKQDVGRRLALNALYHDYGRKGLVWSGPTYVSSSVAGGRITVDFDIYGSKGLAVRNKYGYIEGFAVAGADRVFKWAQARLTRDGRVEVWSDEVHEPVAVRYAWSNNPEANLFNAEGLPAAPFRTDDWPGITIRKK